MIGPMRDEMLDSVHKSLNTGRRLDLSGVLYGMPHGPSGLDPTLPADAAPKSYYYFLAGFVREMGCRRILELGTHMGGSARALDRGFSEPFRGDELIVTIDPGRLAVPILSSHPRIRMIHGLGEREDAVQEALRLFGNKPIDLLFLDSLHEFDTALQQFALYTTLFSPKYVLLDDIALNPEMRRFWAVLCQRYGPFAMNLSEISDQIQGPDPGFGFVYLPGPATAPARASGRQDEPRP